MHSVQCFDALSCITLGKKTSASDEPNFNQVWGAIGARGSEIFCVVRDHPDCYSKAKLTRQQCDYFLKLNQTAAFLNPGLENILFNCMNMVCAAHVCFVALFELAVVCCLRDR